MLKVPGGIVNNSNWTPATLILDSWSANAKEGKIKTSKNMKTIKWLTLEECIDSTGMHFPPFDLGIIVN